MDKGVERKKIIDPDAPEEKGRAGNLYDIKTKVDDEIDTGKVLTGNEIEEWKAI